MLVFLSRGGILGDRKILGKSTVSQYLRKDEESIQEGNNLFIFRRNPITSEDFDNDEGSWTEISMRNIDLNLKKIQTDGEKRKQKLETQLEDYQYIGALSFIIAGSKKNYWIEPEVDLTSVLGDASARESFFKGISSTLKLDMLNQSTFGGEDIYGSRIDAFPFDVNLYAFRSKDKKGNTTSPLTELLLDYDVEENSSDTVMESPASYTTPEPQSFSFGDNAQEEKEATSSSDQKGFQYKNQIDILLKTITRFMGYNLAFWHLKRENFEKYKKNAARIRKDIQVLQGGINTLLVEDESAKKKISLSKSKKKSSSSLTEDDIIYRSSVYSSNLCEIDENVSNLILFLNDRAGIIEGMESEAQFDKLDEVAELSHVLIPLSDQLSGVRKNVIQSFDILRSNLTNSQNRIRNTIDVFNSYRESKRRMSQKKTAFILNIIFAAFAIYELADYVGNFILFGQNPDNDWLTSLWLFLAGIGILLVLFMIIYFFMLKKIWKED